MSPTKWSSLASIVVLVCLSLLAPTARAQPAWPTKPVHLVVPYVAGGGTDVFARIFAEALGARLGQTVVIENRPGAGTMLATGQIARAAPDGYTLIIGTLAHAINATLAKKLAYDPVNDFEFVGKLGQLVFALMVPPKSGINDLDSLVTLLRKEPGKHQYGSAGVGSPMHVGVELLKHLTKTDAGHVPYKGEAAALTDLLGGRITFMLCAVPTCASRIDDGSLRALAVSSGKRSPRLPAIPTGVEAGVRDFETYTWFMIAGPKGLPAPVIERLDAAINAVLADAAFRGRVAPTGTEVDDRSSPAATRAFVLSEIDKWRPIIRATGASVD